MSDNTKTTLDTAFKYKVAPKISQLVPRAAILQSLSQLSNVELEGRKMLWPIQTSDEHGVTYGDGTVFAYNDSVAANFDEAEIESNPVVLRHRLSLAAANRMVRGKESSFLNRMGLKAQVLKQSLMKRAEVAMLYGQTGLGTLASDPGAPSGSQVTITFTAATWAPGIWSGSKGAPLDAYNGTTKINTNADIVVVSVDPANRQVVVSGNDTDLTNLTTGHDIYFKGSGGASSTDMAGIDKIITNTGTLFGVDASTESLWAGNSYAVGGNLTFSKVMEGLSDSVGYGGLEENSYLLISPLTWAKLNSDAAALRAIDSSYSSKKMSNGFEGIEYHGQFGTLTVISHPYVKQGEGFAFPESKIRRIGTTDVDFIERPDGYFEVLEGSAGYQLLAQYEFSVFIDCPAQATKFTGITNS